MEKEEKQSHFVIFIDTILVKQKIDTKLSKYRSFFSPDCPNPSKGNRKKLENNFWDLLYIILKMVWGGEGRKTVPFCDFY